MLTSEILARLPLLSSKRMRSQYNSDQIEMTGPVDCVILLLLVSVTHAELPVKQLNTENILINVTAGTLTDTQLQDPNNLQINLNISVGEEQILVNDIPVELSGVTRFNCQALLLDSINGSSKFESGDLVSTVTRVMVSQNRLYSDSEEVVALQVFSEVIEMEGKEVQQPEMCEVKILMSPDFQKLAQFTNVYPIGHSEIFRVPRENDNSDQIEMTGPVDCVILLLLVSVTHAELPVKQLNTENILINVTAGTLTDTQLQDPNNLQINLNISVGEEQILVNDIPVELSGVTRFNCQALLLDSINGSSKFESGDVVSTVTRVMVSQNRLYSDSEEVVALQVFSEVIEMEGKEVNPLLLLVRSCPATGDV
ncbi:unnamed protein product [Menidia menidia]|uniref:(Atlantic silverside) hypothetical protein n=1 Tax=Menidia menidia TaxID=238744 RepID=A0A8S4B8X4_9TELE|nr:unnamed protein product [Menidia menidia]